MVRPIYIIILMRSRGESERFRQDALIDEFLTAELALCRMVQRINWTLIEELHFDMEIDMELVKEE
ncbi:MAG: hypothetical protein ACLTBD_08730 [Clostridia bacterium]